MLRAVLEVSVLGPVEVRRDGLLVPVPGGKTAELLVRLALDAGVAVRADRLVDDLWGEDAVNTRRNTLQSKVARPPRGGRGRRHPPAATRCSRRSPGCGGRSPTRSRSPVARAATRSPSMPPRST